jgi:hypothetical protein
MPKLWYNLNMKKILGIESIIVGGIYSLIKSDEYLVFYSSDRNNP